MNKFSVDVLNRICPGPANKFEIKDMIRYQKLVSMIPDHSIMVECGNWYGRSICSVSYQIKLKKLEVYCIDINKDRVDELQKNINKFGLAKNVTIITGDSILISKQFNNDTLDLVFLDDDHEYEHLMKEVPAWCLKLKPNGIISGHDYGLTPGVRVSKAIPELFHIDDLNILKNNSIWYTYKSKLRKS